MFTSIHYTFSCALLLSRLATAQIPIELTRGFKNGTTQFVVQYNGNEIIDGEQMTTEATKEIPTFALGDSSGLNAANRYIVVMIDPDAPSRANPTRAQVLHYMGTDFRVDTSLGTNITSNVDAVMPYVGPGPPEGTGLHRYIFLLYAQPRGAFEVASVPAVTERVGFNVSSWRLANNLEPAVAGTYFEAEFGNGTTSGAGSASSGNRSVSASEPERENRLVSDPTSSNRTISGSAGNLTAADGNRSVPTDAGSGAESAFDVPLFRVVLSSLFAAVFGAFVFVM